MASSSSSHQQNRESNAFSGIEPAGQRRKVSESSSEFDVFINHRGPDVKKTLATELYNSLRQMGIRAFLDLEEKELGNSFISTIETAIRSAKVHIAIFSKKYAESPWCLAELLLMLQTKAKIIPVFYEVEPRELRYIEKGVYADAFKRYEEKGRYLEKLSEWKEALNQVSFLAGVEFQSDFKTIVAAVEKEVRRKQCLYVAKYPVGLNNLVKDFEKKCFDELVQDFENQCGLEERNNKPVVVAIFGMGGVGKTTLAKELFNRKLSDYSGASFLFDVREASVKGELCHLQSKLVKDLLHREQSFRSIEEGKSYLNDHLPRIPLNFLIIVDDIDHVEQLDALLIMDIFKKLGKSLVIVTTRDVGVVISTGISIGYALKGMDRDNGRQLFCGHAFDQPFPCAGYKELVDQFVDVCGGLPLSLLVLGRLVHGRDHRFWESNLVKAKKTLPRDVKQRLKISFDALEDEEKQVFMDIACFFLGKRKYMAERILDGSGWGAQTALQTLKDKCLIEEEINEYESLIDDYDDGIVLRMHDHLRDLGREMAVELSPPHRLWRPQDLQSLKLMGLQNILIKTNTRCFHSIFNNSMGCWVEFFLGQSDSCVETSASLLSLELSEFIIQPRSSLPLLPAWIPLQHLQRLKIVGGSFKTLWENHTEIFPHQHQLSTSSRDLQIVSRSDDPIRLRELIISHCHELEKLPSLSRLNYMENIQVKSCEKLQNITLPTKLISLSVQRCKDLQRVSGNGDLVKLTELSISECPELEELPSVSKLSCMEKIDISYCDKLNSIILPTKLISLSVQGCEGLQRVSGNGDLVKLTELSISGCPELEELSSVSKLSCMEKIDISDCKKLNSTILPTKLISLSVQGCEDLQRVSGNGDLVKLTKLSISECPELEELPSASRLSCMERIRIDSCEKLQNITLPTALISLYVHNCRDLQRVVGSGDLINLTELFITECPQLEELPSVSRLSCMERIGIDSCEKLQNITLPTTLISLYVHNCRDLQRVVGSGDHINLTEFFITECPQLEELPSVYRLSCMERIRIDSCEKLQNITLPTTLISLSVHNCRDLQRVVGSGDLLNLTVLIITECPQLDELPSLSRLSCLERIEIHSCAKLQNITLPTTLISLYVHNCRDLQRVVGSGDLINLTELFITECPQLEELPSLSRLSCLEKIKIHSCEKLQNITLPTALISLYVHNCRDLQRVIGSGDLINLTELFITECPQLEELPSLSRQSSIEIDFCEKLKKLSGFEELPALKRMRFGHCSNALIRNCIHNLKSVPSEGMMMIGSAVDGAESFFNKDLFCEANYIGVDEVVEIGDYRTSDKLFCYGKTVVICYLVIVDSSTSAESYQHSLQHSDYFYSIKVRQGEWIITTVTSPANLFLDAEIFEAVLMKYGIKGVVIRMDEVEEWKIKGVLRTIADKLHQQGD